MPSVNTRAFFSKTGRAKYISHLDLSSVVIRAMKRTKLPIWQTEGFNPRTYVTFMLPLSLGQEGLHEAMDFRLTEDVPYSVVRDRLNAALPPDIRVTEITVPKDKNTDITAARYRIQSSADPEKLRALCSQEQINVEKRTKKGSTTVDLKPLMTDVELSGDILEVTLPAGNSFNINPSLLFEAYSAQFGEQVKRLNIVRTHIYSNDREFE
ncbi:MAG: TIGR03936 family radical SAM-associated protein [Oscillospiraceae bacterium]|nr:TIGR03936 family radical SAM-associated protein [Oscillospiraceae bacterium]